MVNFKSPAFSSMFWVISNKSIKISKGLRSFWIPLASSWPPLHPTPMAVTGSRDSIELWEKTSHSRNLKRKKRSNTTATILPMILYTMTHVLNFRHNSLFKHITHSFQSFKAENNKNRGKKPTYPPKNSTQKPKNNPFWSFATPPFCEGGRSICVTPKDEPIWFHCREPAGVWFFFRLKLRFGGEKNQKPNFWMLKIKSWWFIVSFHPRTFWYLLKLKCEGIINNIFQGWGISDFIFSLLECAQPCFVVDLGDHSLDESTID